MFQGILPEKRKTNRAITAATTSKESRIIAVAWNLISASTVVSVPHHHIPTNSHTLAFSRVTRLAANTLRYANSVEAAK